MRHQRKGRKLGRDAAHRKALYANLTGALVTHGRIKTTLAKAQGGAAGRREDGHARQARRPPRAPPGDRVPALEDRRARRCSRRSHRASRSARAATRASSSSARARATRRRWRTSSWSTSRSGTAPPAIRRVRRPSHDPYATRSRCPLPGGLGRPHRRHADRAADGRRLRAEHRRHARGALRPHGPRRVRARAGSARLADQVAGRASCAGRARADRRRRRRSSARRLGGGRRRDRRSSPRSFVARRDRLRDRRHGARRRPSTRLEPCSADVLDGFAFADEEAT